MSNEMRENVIVEMLIEELWEIEDENEFFVLERVEMSDEDGGYDIVLYKDRKFMLCYDFGESLCSIELYREEV